MPCYVELIRVAAAAANDDDDDDDDEIHKRYGSSVKCDISDIWNLLAEIWNFTGGSSPSST